jgi:hypothetical protein
MTMIKKEGKILRGGNWHNLTQVLNLRQVILPCLIIISTTLFAQNDKQVLLDSVEVVGITALQGIGIDRNKVAAKIQTAKI